MSVQILGGRARGFSLQTPPENITRPTAVLLRRRLFDWRQDWSGQNFLDVCAGSGAMGFEALSRGASRVWLNDSHRQAQAVLSKNAETWRSKIGLAEQELLLSGATAKQFLQRWRQSVPAEVQKETVVFFDPPYEQHELYQEFWESMQGFAGEIWVESDELKGPKLATQRTKLGEVVKEVVQGSHWILVGRS
jgi:16S rRNA (guanine966-N2)-methyltransferase